MAQPKTTLADLIVPRSKLEWQPALNRLLQAASAEAMQSIISQFPVPHRSFDVDSFTLKKRCTCGNIDDRACLTDSHADYCKADNS